jgi:hypothetical protein
MQTAPVLHRGGFFAFTAPLYGSLQQYEYSRTGIRDWERRRPGGFFSLREPSREQEKKRRRLRTEAAGTAALPVASFSS